MNVIMVISDTFRRDNLMCYSNSETYAPQIETFSEEAVIFDNAFCGSFPTVPNRNDLLTSRHTFTYKDWAPLGERELVLPEVLGEAGVLTCAIVDTPHPFTPGFNYQRGFDVWEQIRGQETDRWKSYPKDVTFPCDVSKLRNPATVVQYLRNVHDRRTEDDYFCARTARVAMEWLERNRDREPFFLYVDLFDPHEPWDPPQHYIDLYFPNYTGERVIYPRYDRCSFLTDEELRYCRALYHAKVTLVDRWIGALVERIRSLGLWDNTVLIFTTDHGFYLGEHGYIGKSLVTDTYQQCLPMYPEVCSIPLLMRVPGLPTKHVQALVQPVDLPATICDLLGGAIPDTFQGKSLLPLLEGEVSALRSIAISSPRLSGEDVEVPHPSSRSSITDGEWLLVYGSQATLEKAESRGFSLYGTGGKRHRWDAERSARNEWERRGEASGTRLTTRMVDGVERQLRTIEEGGFQPELYHIAVDPGCHEDVLASEREKAESLHSEFVGFLGTHGVRQDHLEYFQSL
jgi:arylsulfatase A-like enzyme